MKVRETKETLPANPLPVATRTLKVANINVVGGNVRQLLAVSFFSCLFSLTFARAVELRLTPELALTGEDVVVTVTGAQPGAKITLSAVQSSFFQTVLRARAEFVADSNGEVDTSKLAPISGTYDGVDSYGLFWSAREEAGLTAPALGTVDIIAEIEGKEIARRTLRRRIKLPGVTQVPVREQGLYGEYFIPAGTGPFPVMIIFGGSEGGLAYPTLQAAYWASRGYACLALAYFRVPGLPEQLANIPLEYFGNALNWIKNRNDTDASRIAVVGASRGGELALLLGAHYSEITAVIASVPSHVTWPGISETLAPSWTWQGKAVASVPMKMEKAERVPVAPGKWAIRLTPAFLDSILDLVAETKALIAVEKIRGPVLMLSGSDDQIWPSCLFAERAFQRLQAQSSYAHENYCYSGAGHLIQPPGYTTTARYVPHPAFDGVLIDMGGDAKASAAANLKAWKAQHEFLAKHLL